MKRTLEKIITGEHLTEQEAYSQLLAIATTVITHETLAGFLVAMQVKGLQLNELKGFQQALLELCDPVDLKTRDYIDVCGTGGDGKDTFNISTSTAFVLASMGYPVVKHGNYGVSSLCGSSNVLEFLGISFSNDTDKLKKQFDKHRLVFLHAPLFHPALKKMAPVRKSLGIVTFLNELGPLVNPAQPKFQLTGTYRMGLARFYQHLLANQREAFYVVHGLQGYDELTFDGPTRVLGKTEDFVLQDPPVDSTIIRSELRGGDIEQSAKILIDVLSGKGNTSQNAVVAGNTALGIRCFEPKTSYQDAYMKALEHLRSGKSIQLLNALRA